MGFSIWDDDYSYLNDRDAQDYDDYVERLEREERERDDWMRTRYAEPGDPDYDEFDSLTSVEEYIEEHRDELTREEICALVEEYSIIDHFEGEGDDFGITLTSTTKPAGFTSTSKPAASDDKTVHEKAQQPLPSGLKPDTSSDIQHIKVTIISVLGFLMLIWGFVHIESLLTFLFFILLVGFLTYFSKR